MNKILFSLAAVLSLTLAATSPALATPKASSSNHTVAHNTHTINHASSTSHVSSMHLNKSGNYMQMHGTKFAQGYKYQGKNHTHWTQRRFDRRYNCECYFDPCCSAWYYWCQPDCCYYPVSYCPYRTYCWTAPCVQPVCVECAPPVVTQQVRTVRYVTTNVYRTTCTPVTTVETCLSPPCVVSGNGSPSYGPPVNNGPPGPQPGMQGPQAMMSGAN